MINTISLTSTMQVTEIAAVVFTQVSLMCAMK